jgi:misacylated tRNA(Ala) deacylase
VVLASSPAGIILSTSAFYPGGGDRPVDRGVLLWQDVETRIDGVRKGDDLYVIPVGDDPIPSPGTTVWTTVADERRSALRVAKIESKGKGFRRLRIEVAD